MRTGRGERGARIAFATPELLWRVLSAKRWELLKAMCGAGPMSIREAARRVGRDKVGALLLRELRQAINRAVFSYPVSGTHMVQMGLSAEPC